MKTSRFVFADSVCVIICFLILSLRWKMCYKFSLKIPKHVIITQRSASDSNAAGPVRSTIANKTVIFFGATSSGQKAGFT